MNFLDTLTPEERSERMSRVRSKDTKPEMVVRRLVHAMGYRYRLRSVELFVGAGGLALGTSRASFKHLLVADYNRRPPAPQSARTKSGTSSMLPTGRCGKWMSHPRLLKRSRGHRVARGQPTVPTIFPWWKTRCAPRRTGHVPAGFTRPRGRRFEPSPAVPGHTRRGRRRDAPVFHRPERRRAKSPEGGQSQASVTH